MMISDSKTDRIVAKIVSELGPINKLLEDPAVIDIMYNPSGDVYVERFGIGIVKEKIDYSKDRAALVMRSIASFNDLTVGEDAPLLSAVLPSGQRFQGFVYPAVEAPSFSIRCNRSINITLDDCVPNTILSEHRQILHNALAEKKNIILSGGTGSGKTTFCSALMDELYRISPDDRVIIMEDVAEMQIKHKNVLHERKTPRCGYSQLLQANLRANPDRIILGECRGSEAYDLLNSWNTGHPGGVTTIHANSAESTFNRLETLILMNEEAKQLNLLAVRASIAEAVDLVVQISRKAGCVPKVTQILKVNNNINLDGTYNTEALI